MSDIEEAFAAFAETRTLEAAQRLEGLLDEAYPDDPLIQECVEVLACYRPESGEYLFDAQQIEPHLRRLRTLLGFGVANP